MGAYADRGQSFLLWQLLKSVCERSRQQQQRPTTMDEWMVAPSSRIIETIKILHYRALYTRVEKW